MMTCFLATVYPGGALAVLSALLWLLLTVLVPFALVIGCLGVWCSLGSFAFAIKSLKFAILASILAVLFIALETGSVWWDAFFVLEDKAYFFEQFPVSFIRVAVNLATLLLSWLAYRAAGKKRLVLSMQQPVSK